MRLALLGLVACGPDARTALPEPPSAVGALVFDGPAPRNVLMISIDTLRRDHVGRYAAVPGLTPFLDELASQGVALDDLHQCANWTFPTTSCTLGGRDPVDLGVLPRLDPATRRPLLPGTPLLAGWLAEAGLDTWLFSVNTWLSSQWGNAAGYDHEVWPGIFHTQEIVRRAANQLEASIDAGDTDRWFLHVHVKEPHAPYRPPWDYMSGVADLPPIPWDLDEFEVHYEVTRDLWAGLTPDERDLVERHLRVRYEGEVRWLDDELRDALADLDARGLLDDTLVVLWTDHGEQFWEHGAQTHAYALHAEETDAVAIFWAKNLRARAWTEPTTSTDLAPTVLAAMGAPIPAEVTGRIVGTAPPDRPRFAHTIGRLGPIDAVERGGTRLVFDWSGARRAYDLAADPTEQVDVFDAANPEHAALWDLLRARVLAESDLAPDLPLTLP